MKEPLDRIFVAYKPSFIGSNKFLSQLKRKYGVKKAGFSGTLDPFARGVLVVAFGRFTRLFSHLKKTPKVYEATLWLGASSETLDIESQVTDLKPAPYTQERVANVLKSFIGTLAYVPPKYSAKKIDGKRAYAMARAGEPVTLKHVSSEIYDIELILYNHPFLTFKATVSEGTYIRSLGELMAQKLGTEGILSKLERLNEGILFFENEKALRPIEIVDAKENHYLGPSENIDLGKKIALNELKIREDGKYLIRSKDNFAIISIEEGCVSYLLNKVPLC